MKLSGLVAGHFESQVRQRGRKYYERALVEICESGSAEVYAVVNGTKEYDVFLCLENNNLIVECSCPYFLSAGPCKHIWAALLHVEESGYLTDFNAQRPIRLKQAGKGDEEGEDDLLTDEFSEERYAYDKGYAEFNRQIEKRSPQRQWRKIINGIQQNAGAVPRTGSDNRLRERQLVYIIEVDATLERGDLCLTVNQRERKSNGDWGRVKSIRFAYTTISGLSDPKDREIIPILNGIQGTSHYYPYAYSYRASEQSYFLNSDWLELLLPKIITTGRCYLRHQSGDNLSPLQIDEAGPWEFYLKVCYEEAQRRYTISGILHRKEEHYDVSEPEILLSGGWVFWRDKIGRFNDPDAFAWISALRKEGEIHVPEKEAEALLKVIFDNTYLPRIDLPQQLQCHQIQVSPKSVLKIYRSNYTSNSNSLLARLSFDYGGIEVSWREHKTCIFHRNQRQYLLRDKEAEQQAQENLLSLKIRPVPSYRSEEGDFELSYQNMPDIVRTLLAQGWRVEAEGKLCRRSGSFNISVTSGIDWFELHGGCDFEGVDIPLPELLNALKRGENMIKLGDGSVGILPEEWLKRYGLLAGMGKAHKDHLRFSKSQFFILDVLVASQAQATCDETFALMRERLRNFESIKPSEAPQGFNGKLRDYQKEGLGWLFFLQHFGLGGCLADDMGLGKTIQVLAFLESRRPSCHSLVVVPRSLIFNWRQEAARFTPDMRVLDNSGQDRVKDAQELLQYNMVLTTYGTLCRDITWLKDITFDYVILDEAQAIKNADTYSAKAARLLNGKHHLALSGTPIENHLGELWSIFEFLNPGMLGTVSCFNSGVSRNQIDEEERVLLARALRPFILRRTKSQVAKDLPEKFEETVYCELGSTQRQLYNELRDHYRHSLLSRIDEEGLNRAKIQVLEALLRLRQAACHPGLIDPDKKKHTSAKVECLLPQVKEVMSEGHKALIFSQFTSLLSIVRAYLDEEKIVYEYLDGKTRNREERVKRFQEDPECRLFLISLKAGGQGLNLTAAGYVFLLDPWWNPAVEAQAIDRTHRIGQTQNVFAYRLIARDTVEEKVIELQSSKRNLAEAIINADNSLIRDLTRNDLELLLQ